MSGRVLKYTNLCSKNVLPTEIEAGFRSFETEGDFLSVVKLTLFAQ